MRKINPELYTLLEIATRKDIRIGQLMCCIEKMASENNKKLFYMENDELEKYIEKFLFTMVKEIKNGKR